MLHPSGAGVTPIRGKAGPCELAILRPMKRGMHVPGELWLAHKRKPTTDAVEILHRRYFQGKPERLSELEEARGNHDVALKIHDLREKAGMTQAALAKRVGTTASVIRQFENADYEGHSLTMLRRIAAALNRRVEIRFVPTERKLTQRARNHPDERIGRPQ